MIDQSVCKRGLWLKGATLSNKGRLDNETPIKWQPQRAELLFLVGLAIAGLAWFLKSEQLPLVRPEPTRGNIISLAPQAALIGPPVPPQAEDVVAFVTGLHVHGIRYEDARRFGPEAVPVLLDMLADPAYAANAVNIIVTLGFLGQPEARQPLLDYLQQLKGEQPAEAYRSAVAVPYALAQLAHQGDDESLQFLLDASTERYWRAAAARWSWNGQQPDRHMYESVLLALGISGLQRAELRLQEMLGQTELTAQENDTLDFALALNRQVRSAGMAAAVNADPSGATDPDALAIQADDTNPFTHLQSFSVGRHSSEAGLNSDAKIDEVLQKATEVMRFPDSEFDIACCIRLRRSEPLGIFSATDGTIDTPTELTRLFSTEVPFQIKIVPALNYCGSLNPSIIGCAPISLPANFVVESLNDTTLSGILWAHEFGHNQGLEHTVNIFSRIMNNILSLGAREMTIAECSLWHSTPYNPGTVTGPCPELPLVSKSWQATGVITSGTVLTYFVTVQNDNFVNLADIVITDTIPVSTSHLAGSTSTSTGGIPLNDFPNTPAGPFDVPAQSSVTISYAVEVGPVQSKDLLTSLVQVSGARVSLFELPHTVIVDPELTYLPVIIR